MGGTDAVRAAFEHLPVMVCAVAGPDHVYVAANRATRELIGGRDVIGMPLARAYPELVAQQFVELLDRVRDTGELVSVPEWRMHVDVDASGEMRELFFDLTFSPVPGADGAVEGIVCHIIDASERVRRRRDAQQDAQQDAATSQRRYLAARDVVTELQEALLPTALPVLPGATVAGRYLVAASDQSAGGDWFDAVPLPDGRLGLVVGDVVGHGVTASAAMGQLRTTVNRVLAETGDLDQSLRWADRMAADSVVMSAATLCVAVLDPSSGALSYSTCGHLPPLVVGADGSRYLARTGAGPLGTRSPLTIAEHVLGPGEVLVLFSDGLVERAGVPLGDGLDALAEVASDAAANRVFPVDAPPSVVERVSQQSVEVMTRAGYDDDVTVLAVQRRPEPLAVLDLSCPADVGELGGVRAAVLAWLDQAGVARRDREAIDLAVSELTANVVEHAYVDARRQWLRVRAELDTQSVVTARVDDDGVWQRPGAAPPTTGRGLWLAGAVADELVVDEGVEDHGTVVTLRRRVSHPAQLATDVTHPLRARRGGAFTVQVESGPPPVLKVTGPVDATTATEFAHRVDVVTRGGLHQVTIDLTDVDLLASAGVRTLFRVRDRLATHGQPLLLVAPEPCPAQQVLDLVGLERRAD